MLWLILRNQKGKLAFKAMHHYDQKLVDNYVYYENCALIRTVKTNIALTKPLSDKKRAYFYQQLYEALKTRDLYQALIYLSLHLRDKNLQAKSKSISKRVGKGLQLSQALRYEGIDFPLFEIRLIEGAESLSQVNEVLTNLARQLEASHHRKKMLKKKSAYPLLLLGACILLCFYIFMFILPKLRSNMPLSTQPRILVIIETFLIKLRTYKEIIILLSLMVSVFLFLLLHKRFKNMKILLYKSSLYADNKTICLLNLMKLTVLSSQNHFQLFSFIERNTKDRLEKKRFKYCKALLESGHSLSYVCTYLKHYNPLLNELLLKAFDFDLINKYQKQISDDFEIRLNEMIDKSEPIITVIMGLSVLFIMLLVLLPMMSYYDTIL